MKKDYEILEEAIEALSNYFTSVGKTFLIATAIEEDDAIVGNFAAVNAEYTDYTHSLFVWSRIMNEDAIETLNLKGED